MCGISGFFGNLNIKNNTIQKTLKLMKFRGPDNQSFKFYKLLNKNLYLLHSRLSIIDLDVRSNQPFETDDLAIVFNGEIYNYIELKKDLIRKGEKFKSESDTEVLLKTYKIYGTKCVDILEGMWSFSIFDKKKNILFLSRDRFGEKPLFYYIKNNKFYFGSEIKFIKSLLEQPLEINYTKIQNFLNYGYKYLKKDKQLFFKGIKELSQGSNIIIDLKNNFKIEKYWQPKVNIDYKISENDAINNTKKLIIDSIKKTTRSDVPIAFTLSGGVDSSALVSVASKTLNIKFKTYSIIDDDKRYDERININKVLKALGCENKQVKINNKNSLDLLKEMVNYHEKPLASIAQYNHYNLMKEIKKDGIKVCLNGTMSDEIFAGYLDHHLQFFSTLKDKALLKEEVEIWKKKILPNIRNPIFRKYDLYIKNKNYRSHIYDNHINLKNYLLKNTKYKFAEKNFSKILLKNRMLNEIFFENTPQILHDEDLNSMKNSIENRSPFIDKRLFEFLLSVPPKYFIKKGFKKNILRKSMQNIVDYKVLWDVKKMGFNSGVENIFNFKDKKILDYLLDKNSEIYQIVNHNKFKNLLSKQKFPNYLSKFIFNVLNSKLFIESIIK